MTITYQVGDATRPEGEGLRLIAHICNDIGAWGSGFVMALSRRDREPELCYRQWHEGSGPVTDVPFELGRIQLTRFNPWPEQISNSQSNVYVINMIAQRGVRHDATAPPAVDYEALGTCLDRLSEVAVHDHASIHMPRIGCGLGGGDWNVVSRLIDDTLSVHGVPVTVYDLPGTSI